MRFVSFLREGQESFGVSTRGGIADVGAVLRPRYPDLGALIASGRAILLALDAIEGLPARIREHELDFLPPIARPDKIFCIGVNYAGHAPETGIASAPHPTVFLRYADAQVGHGQALVAPMESHEFDFEGELAIVIGAGGRRIPEQRAWDHVFSCEVMQCDTTDHLVHDVPALVTCCSTLLPLVFLRAGDVVEVEITGLGCLRNTVEQG